MAFNRLFEQVQVGPLTLKNRLILPGMERGYATPLGEVTQRYVDYIEARARGGVGLIVVESTYVEPSGKVRLAQLGVHDNSLIPGLRRLADVCHAHGVKIGTQITHAGRQTSSQFTGKQPIAPSSISCSRVPSSEPVREMAVAEIEAYVRKFAEAAKRLQDAGLNQFVSPYTNKRNDAYGGTAEKRMRFPLEIVAAVRAAVGEGLAISYRLSAHEFVEGGLVPEDLVPLVKALERAGVDIVGVSAGNYDSVVWTTPGPDCPPGYYAELAKPIKAALKIPVYVAGRINTPELAERLIREGKTDLVAMARVLHADPEMPNKARQGKVEEIRRCVYCMHCSDLLSSNQLVSCLVNPAAGRERTFQRVGSASAPKRVVVAGGGPAGLAAARSLASKGHKVILFEKEAKMGGQIPYAASAPHKEEFIEVVSYLIRQVDKLGVEVRMGKTATVEAVMALNPDVAVIATGARPNYPPIQGIDPTSGCETAEYLANRGSEVVLVEMTDALARDAGSRSSYPIKKRVSEHQHIQIHLLTIVTEVGDDYAVLQQGGVSMRVEELGLIVVSTGMLADRTLADALIAAGFKGQLHVIGDSERPRKAADAIYEGETLGLML